ncbi:dihydrodipicolinate synthase [Neorickettsia helminthoeca str. Oregon]|uniref:4-hydroxy-tetrahydrodipicolinate synthase n=1 Tax=Neorickettsia helminthoeca str. Oregon TaxID=1286528 RepID=X5GXL8_9RICK|nr:4-hydroxy-tetrahydrodipicolinate synthase [Neorickettsia helminthoeca]AHX11807.1 dihydrodipicolinate synthase [Neorickettsia helminthoeca str. Oregon]
MASERTFEGVFTAVVTPFKREQVDYEGFRILVESQIGNGIHGIVVAGSTGESQLLSHSEYLALIDCAVDVVKERVPLIVGVPHCATSKVIEEIVSLKERSVSAFLISTPYYVLPQQEGIFEHYRAITEKTKANIIVYNIPHRCGVNIENSTMLRIMDLPGVVAIKDASGNLECPTILKAANERVPILMGNDTQYAAHRLHGGDGVISAVSNLIPSEMLALENAIRSGQYERMKALHKAIFPLAKSIFCETNPGPLKYALSCVNKCITHNVRHPLVNASDSTKRTIQNALEEFEKEKIRLSELCHNF